MRLVAWNIRAGGGRRVDGIARQLARWTPDVIALCEFRGTPPSAELATRLAEGGHPHQCHAIDRRRPGLNGVLVASRWPVRPVRLAAAPIDPCRWLLASVGARPSLVVGAMHVPNRVSGKKYPFLDAVLACIARWRLGPALLLGDTNSGRRRIDEEVPAFNAREEAWIDALADRGWVDAFRHVRGDAPAYSWYSPNGRHGFRIDQAFVNRALVDRVRDARYVWGRGGDDGRREALSDHAALIVDLDGL